MGIIVLVSVLMLASCIFFRGAKTISRFYKQLFDLESNICLEYREKYPKWHICLRFSLPIIIIGFYFNAIAAATGAGYVIVRWFSE